MALSLTSRSALRTLNVENKQKNLQAQKSSTNAVKTSLFRDFASEGKGLSFAGCSKPGLKVHVGRKSHFIHVLILSLLLARMYSHVCEKSIALAYEIILLHLASIYSLYRCNVFVFHLWWKCVVLLVEEASIYI